MEPIHLVWSATSCEYPGAGLYFGLARHSEVARLCQSRSNRQMRLYRAAMVRGLGGRMLPCYYLAIRDPSSIKVRVVEQPRGSQGPTADVRYVSLLFECQRVIAAGEEAAALREREVAASSDAAFVVTVSLPIAREEEFFRRHLPREPGEEWTSLFDRLCDGGTR